MADAPTPTTPDLKGAAAAHQKHLPAAKALDPRDVLTFRADSVLAYHNLNRGIDAVAPLLPTLKGRLTPEELARLEMVIAEALEQSLAVIFADIQVDQLSGKIPTEIAKKLEEGRELRRILLGGARACADAGLVPESEVREIERGRGNLDVAKDDVALSAFYRKYSNILTGRTPATKQQIERAGELGTELVTLLRPTGAKGKRAKPEALREAMDHRDRLWTLTVNTHRDIWTIGALLFGLDVSEHVPALQSRVVAKKPEKPKEEKPQGETT